LNSDLDELLDEMDVDVAGVLDAAGGANALDADNLNESRASVSFLASLDHDELGTREDTVAGSAEYTEDTADDMMDRRQKRRHT
jgi:hypothetical protein